LTYGQQSKYESEKKMIRLVTESKRLGVSQADLMRRTGLHPSTLSNIFNGRMKPWGGQAERIYEALQSLGYNGTKEALFEEVGE
jgi:transcriptional regulator with XRE-family HTH domain